MEKIQNKIENMKVNIIIPAHNEEKRIGRTLKNYCDFFDKVKKNKNIDTRFTIVLNGCTDRTYKITADLKEKYNSINILNLKKAGKGLAVTEGFKCAIKEPHDLIGFVDADMATQPKYFYELIEKIKNNDAIIASRYMKESKVFPARPLIKNWGRKLIFNPLTRLLFRIKYKDFQCGAKLFKPYTLKKIVNKITDKQWTFDIELLYLCRKNGFKVKELPTIWYDQEFSKFKLVNSGIKMIKSMFKLRVQHSIFSKLIKS